MCFVPQPPVGFLQSRKDIRWCRTRGRFSHHLGLFFWRQSGWVLVTFQTYAERWWHFDCRMKHDFICRDTLLMIQMSLLCLHRHRVKGSPATLLQTQSSSAVWHRAQGPHVQPCRVSGSPDLSCVVGPAPEQPASPDLGPQLKPKTRILYFSYGFYIFSTSFLYFLTQTYEKPKEQYKQI